MLYIRTGKPGHGKTLNTIREVDQKAHKEGRVVYYHNVSDLKTDQLQAAWFEFDDPYKWYELPADAIIVQFNSWQRRGLAARSDDNVLGRKLLLAAGIGQRNFARAGQSRMPRVARNLVLAKQPVNAFAENIDDLLLAAEHCGQV